jgi:outer membrane immunogenic protein
MGSRSFYLLPALIVGSITAANAADAVIEQSPVPVVEVPVFSWAGGYIGTQVGYGWGDSKFSDRFDADAIDYGSISMSPDGFIGGIYAGYNFVAGENVVLGIDADITYSGLEESYSQRGDVNAAAIDSELRWSGAVRARLGYAADRFLPYIAGGVAFGQVKNQVYVNSLSWDDDQTLTGWTIGAGVDYAMTDNVILRLEYRYTDYGDKDFSFDGAGVRNDFTTNDIRLGIAYKF